jgi:hypothetical protein
LSETLGSLSAFPGGYGRGRLNRLEMKIYSLEKAKEPSFSEEK